MENPMTRARQLRDLLRQDGLVVAPGANDDVFARMGAAEWDTVGRRRAGGRGRGGGGIGHCAVQFAARPSALASRAIHAGRLNAMTISRRRFLHAAAAASAMPMLARPVAAQTWPARPIRAMVPFSAGSSLDIVGRIVL